MVRFMTHRWTSRRARLSAVVVGMALVAACSQTSPASDSSPGEVGDRASVRPAPSIPDPGAAGSGPTAPDDGTPDESPVPEPTAPPTTTPPPTPPVVGFSTVWNTPVSALKPGNQEWADRLCQYGDVWGSCGDRWTAEMMGPAGNDYSIPIYDVSTATTTMKVRRKNAALWNGIFNIAPSAALPWNPIDWVPSRGKDGYMIVRDSQTGHEWGFWNVSWWNHQTEVNHNLHCDPIIGGSLVNLPAPLGVGYDPNTMLCAASAFQVTDPQGRPVDTRTWPGNYPGATGGGWPIGQLVVTPDQVKSGSIRHALHFYSANTMDGPECAPSQRHLIGISCGGAIAPAGQLEKGNYDGQALAHQVPEGARFSLDLTDAQIESWLTSRGYTGKLRSTARTIAVALRDYGWFLGDSSPTSAFWVFDSSPTARTGWRELGIQGDGKDLLRGLVKPDNIKAWAPPTMTCADGTKSQWYCFAVDGSYAG